MSKVCARLSGLFGVALAAVAALAGTAAAAPLALDAPGNVSSLSQALVAFGPSTSTTYVAWDAVPAGTGIELCIVAPDASSCAGGGAVLLTDSSFTGDNTPTLSGLLVMPGGNVVVTGVAGNSGTIAWASPPGGAGFLASGHGLQAGGEPISMVNSFYQPDDVVPLSATDLGILDGEHNLFGDVPYTTASSNAGVAADPEVDFSGAPLDTGGAPQIGAEPTPGGSGDETVVSTGVSNNSSSQTNSGCPSVNNTGYSVRVGKVGSLDSATPSEALLACSADNPVITSGGKDGIGVVEEEGSGVAGASPASYTVDFRPFDATASGGSFGTAVQLANTTSQVLDGIDSLDATDDPGTGVYALWGDDQGEVLDYSPNGGGNWGPADVTTTPYGDGENMAGVGNGVTLIAYIANPSGSGDQVFLAPVQYLAPVTVSTSQSYGTTTGADITIPAGVHGESDRASIASFFPPATGTVKFTLYAKSDCSASSAVFSGVATVSGGVAAIADDASPALQPGKYYWRAAYSGAGLNAPGISACGSEVLTVDPAAIASTATSTSTTVTITVTCVTPCTITVTVTDDPPHRSTTLASGKFSLKKGKFELNLKLTAAGRTLLRKDHYKLLAAVSWTTKTSHATVKASQMLNIRRK